MKTVPEQQDRIDTAAALKTIGSFALMYTGAFSVLAVTFHSMF